MATDGQVAVIVNKVFRSMRQIDGLSERYSPEVAAKREVELRERIDRLIAEITASGHVAAREIGASVCADYTARRTKYVAAGARRFFNLPLNWIIRDGEVVMEAAIAVAKAKARKRAIRPSSRPHHESLPQ